MDSRKIKLYIDFDGTVTRRDVGNEFFRHFGGEQCDRIVSEYRSEKISAQECFRGEAAAMRPFSLEEARALLAQQEVDGTFSSLVTFCRQHAIDLSIVSDGLDFYIQEILTVRGFRDIQVFANRAELIPDANGLLSLSVHFPYSDAECDRCGCCKRNIILTHSGEDEIIIFVGEGYSDRCPAEYADIVFAKDALQTYCQEQNISYFLYNSFADVVTRLTDLLALKSFRKRLNAELKRREAFLAE